MFDQMTKSKGSIYTPLLPFLDTHAAIITKLKTIQNILPFSW